TTPSAGEEPQGAAGNNADEEMGAGDMDISEDELTREMRIAEQRDIEDYEAEKQMLAAMVAAQQYSPPPSPVAAPVPVDNTPPPTMEGGQEETAAGAPADDLIVDEPHSADEGQRAVCAVSSPGGGSIPALVDYPASPSSPGTPGTPEPPSPLLVIIPPTPQTTEGAMLQVPVPLARPRSRSRSRSPIPASPKLGSDGRPLHNTRSQG
ncbi:hypothetical protein C0991_012149, partial [Blastosporella zonata]